MNTISRENLQIACIIWSHICFDISPSRWACVLFSLFILLVCFDDGFAVFTISMFFGVLCFFSARRVYSLGCFWVFLLLLWLLLSFSHSSSIVCTRLHWNGYINSYVWVCLWFGFGSSTDQKDILYALQRIAKYGCATHPWMTHAVHALCYRTSNSLMIFQCKRTMCRLGISILSGYLWLVLFGVFMYQATEKQMQASIT